MQRLNEVPSARFKNRRADLIALILILSASAVLAHGYFGRIHRPFLEARFRSHHQILDGTAPSPYRYRVLSPWIGEALTHVFPSTLPPRTAFLRAYLIHDVLAIFSLLALLYLWLKTWFSREQALVGVFFVAATMPIALQDHQFQPWSLLEAAFFTAALLATYRKNYWWLGVLVVLSAFNRETGIFVPAALLLASLPIPGRLRAPGSFQWKPLLLACAFFVVSTAIFFGLRQVLGTTAHVHTIQSLVAKNTDKARLFWALTNTSLFLGGFWVFALLGFRHAPDFIRRITWILPPYLVTILLWGVWHEVRLLLPLYPLLLPLGLSFIYRPDLGAQPEAVPEAVLEPIAQSAGIHDS